MRRLALLTILVVFVAGCASPPAAPVDPAVRLLEAGEPVRLRVPADLMHGHDMEEPAYDAAEGYRPIPTYPGELLLTDRRLLFIVTPAGPEGSWVSIPYAAIARARPSRTPLLHYIVVWDAGGHADSFIVDASVVQSLHRSLGEALLARGRMSLPPTAPRHLAP